MGARKIRKLLVRRLDGDLRVPTKSAIHAVLHRHGLVKPIGWPHHRARAAINRFLHKHNPEPKPFTLSADSNKVIGVVRRGHQGLVSLHWVDYSTAR